jgi:hypothetical protein
VAPPVAVGLWELYTTICVSMHPFVSVHTAVATRCVVVVAAAGPIGAPSITRQAPIATARALFHGVFIDNPFGLTG